jgi:hypothetical protein
MGNAAALMFEEARVEAERDVVADTGARAGQRGTPGAHRDLSEDERPSW